ncbi:MAG TPA: hypothetical protein VNA57_00360 [Acidimicrobiales bacterium]|nr:hypothetical protein [Acidimicrobiales bacterium]
MTCAMLLIGCGGDGDEAEPISSTSTSVVHETAGTIPPPGPATSGLLVASPSLQVPIADPGSRAVVTWGNVTDSAIVAIFRNMTRQTVTDVAVAARRRGRTELVGPPGLVVPSVLNPGEWGMALVVLDEPGAPALEFDVKSATEPRITLAVQSAEGRDGGVAGVVGNQTERAVKDVMVDVVCFSGSRPKTMARLRPTAGLAAGASASFAAPIQGTPCTTWAVVASALPQ